MFLAFSFSNFQFSGKSSSAKYGIKLECASSNTNHRKVVHAEGVENDYNRGRSRGHSRSSWRGGVEDGMYHHVKEGFLTLLPWLWQSNFCVKVKQPYSKTACLTFIYYCNIIIINYRVYEFQTLSR